MPRAKREVVSAAHWLRCAGLRRRSPHKRMRAISREIGVRQSEGTARTNLGSALVEVRRFEEAIAAQEDVAASSGKSVTGRAKAQRDQSRQRTG